MVGEGHALLPVEAASEQHLDVGLDPLEVLVGLLAVISYVVGRQRAYAVSRGSIRNLRSLPSHYGTYALVLTAAPALVLLLGWSIVEPAMIDRMMIAELPD